MGQAASRRGALAHGLVALLVVGGATACATTPNAAAPPPPGPSISAVPMDPEVAATGLPDGTDVEVTDSSTGPDTGDDLDFVSPLYTVKAVGPLDRAATFTLQLDNALPQSTPLVVATRQWEGDEWTYHRGRLTSDQRHVRFRATQLDQAGVLAVDRTAAVSSFRSDVRRGLRAPQATKAVAPTCTEPDAARESGYEVEATENKTLFWCLGLEKEKRVLTVTNRRSVPVEIAHRGMDVVTASETPAAYASWPEVLGTTYTLLGPGRSATYDADIEAEGKVAVVATSTSQAQSLRVLQAVSRGLVKRLNDFGVGPVKPGRTESVLLRSPSCTRALKAGVDALAKRCFTMPVLTKVFGSRALLLDPLVSGPYPPVFLGKLGARLKAEAGGQRERVVVRREAEDFSALVGSWVGLTRSLNVDAKGVVGERLEDAKGRLVIDLTYQLADPVTQDGTTSAAATLTKVTVGNRKLLNGRLPQAGDKGRISRRKGVITPPFLKTNYCDAATAKKGTCGG